MVREFPQTYTSDHGILLHSKVVQKILVDQKFHVALITALLYPFIVTCDTVVTDFSGYKDIYITLFIFDMFVRTQKMLFLAPELFQNRLVP